jgi:alanine racemase
MSHFSSAAGTKTSLDKSKKQIQEFTKLEKKLKKLGGNTLSSLCNSGGLLNYKKSHKDIMRPGIAIFGVNQKETGKKITLKPALTLKSKFISIKEVKKGGKVGYDGSWTAKKDSVIGILPIGYADGYPVTLSNNGYVLVNGKKANVIGRISMDLIAIDLTSLSNVDYESVVILYGKGLPIEVISKLAGIIPYSLMTSLTERVKKKYI